MEERKETILSWNSIKDERGREVAYKVIEREIPRRDGTGTVAIRDLQVGELFVHDGKTKMSSTTSLSRLYDLLVLLKEVDDKYNDGFAFYKLTRNKE